MSAPERLDTAIIGGSNTPAASALINHLDLWTSSVTYKSSAGRGSNSKIALTGIARLRELILELAVRGKLVPQDPNDEPASELLQRIEAEKARLVTEGKIKKQNPLSAITVEDAPFDLPTGWRHVRLGNLVEMYNGRAFKSSEWSTEGLPIVRIQNLNDKTAPFNYFNGVLEEKNLISNSTFLISWSGTPGTSFGAFIWNRGPAALNQHINKCVFFGEELNSRFMQIAVNGRMTHFIERAQGGVGLKHVTKGTLNNAIVGLPPVAEQHRIVAKVDELMTLCDQLEQQTSDQISAHDTLVDVLLESLLTPADSTLTPAQAAAELANNWARLAAHFDTLFTTEHSIERLKQIILQLAVMGRLVPQDPNDEPASELLKRIEAEKAQLVNEGKIKKPKRLPEISEDEKPFELPAGWNWSRFGNLVNFRSELVKSSDYPDSEQIAPDSIEKGSGRLLERRTVKQSGVKGPNNQFYKGQILYSKIRPSLSKAIIAPCDGLCSADMYPLDSLLSDKYLLKIILSEPFLVQVRAAENRIKMPKLNIDSLSNIVVPVPPSSKIESIVTKVDELIALCDQLKARLTQANTTRCHLAEEVVKQGVTV